MIEIEDVSKYFFIKRGIFHSFQPRRKTAALDSVSLSISENRIFALLGPNGAGKTTLIKIICGLILPDKGKVSVEGKIGYLSAEIEGFYPQLTARQNLEFFGVMYNLHPSLIAEQIGTFSQTLSIADLDKPFWTYSTGTKHRLSLLRVLMLGRDIIIMDEPTKSLDPLSAKQLRELISRLAGEFKKTVIFATHSLSEAETIADTIAIMDKGKIALQGNMDELKSHYRGEGESPLEAAYVKAVS